MKFFLPKHLTKIQGGTKLGHLRLNCYMSTLCPKKRHWCQMLMLRHVSTGFDNFGQECSWESMLSNTHTRLTALSTGLPRWAGTRKVKPIWIILKQETVSGSGISWAICKSASCSRQTTTPALHDSVFYRPDALPAAQPTASKHWRQRVCYQAMQL